MPFEMCILLETDSVQARTYCRDENRKSFAQNYSQKNNFHAQAIPVKLWLQCFSRESMTCSGDILNIPVWEMSMDIGATIA